MSNVIAGVVRGQFPYLDEHIAQKKAIYERYKEGFKDLPVEMNPYDGENSEPNFWLSCMLIKPEAMCKQVRGEQEALYIGEAGKRCPTEILETLAKYNAYINGGALGADGKPLDTGMDLFHRGLCLPSDNKMTVEEQDRIIEIIKGCFE